MTESQDYETYIFVVWKLGRTTGLYPVEEMERRAFREKIHDSTKKYENRSKSAALENTEQREYKSNEHDATPGK